MKARKLLEESTFDPQLLKVLNEAFDDAWEQLSRYVGNNLYSIEAARMKLATNILKLAKNGMSANPAQLTEKAIELMHERPTEL